MRRKLLAAVLLVVVAVLVILDARQPSHEQIVGRVAIGSIHLYQATLSRLYSRMGVRCRFVPNCSHYGEICIRQFGIARGGWLAVRRVLRCGPWTPLGTILKLL